MKEKYLDMKDNLIDIIKEEQAKLGYRKESIRLYYPLGSLKHLLKADADIERVFWSDRSYKQWREILF